MAISLKLFGLCLLFFIEVSLLLVLLLGLFTVI